MNSTDHSNPLAVTNNSSSFHRRFLRPSLLIILISALLALLLSQIQVDTAMTAYHPTEQVETTFQRFMPPNHGISEIFTPEIHYWEDDILGWSEEYGLDPNLIATVMQIESCGYAKAKSAAGALGLFQVMPQHFKEEDNPFDPDTNAYRGLRWLQRTLKSGGSIEMALAGYNAGIARAKNPHLEWPSETQRYVDWGSKIYQAADHNYVYSSALYDWLSRGGQSLCNKAAAAQQDK
jgi:hypothetical protein